MQLAAVALAAFSALGAASPGAAPALDLSWAATPPCSSREEVVAEVARLLRTAGGDERAVAAHATLTASEGGAIQVELLLEIAGAAHRRAFEAESCQAAKSALALILAIAINPAAASAAATVEAPASAEASDDREAPPVQPPASSTSPSTAAQPRPPPPAAAAAAKRTPASSALWFGVAGKADLGTLPRLSPGGELQLIYQLGPARVEAAASFLGAQAATEPTSPAGATFSAVSAQLRFAYGAELGKVWAAPFASVGLTRLRAVGLHGTLNFDQHALVPEVGAGALLSWQALGALGVRLSAEGLAPTFRPRFVVEEPQPAPKQTVYQSSKVVGRVMIGATIQFL